MPNHVHPVERESPELAHAAGRVSDVVRLPLAVARRVLPEGDLPVYLGVGALAIPGAIGIGYAALKQWDRSLAYDGDGHSGQSCRGP